MRKTIEKDEYIDATDDKNMFTQISRKFKIRIPFFEEVKKVSHRDFTTGFYFGQANQDSQVYETNSYIRGYDFIGLVLDYDEKTKIATVEQRNRIFKGEEIEIFGPGIRQIDQTITEMYDKNDKEIEVANRALQIFKIKVDEKIQPGYMIRRRSE